MEEELTEITKEEKEGRGVESKTGALRDKYDEEK